MCLTETDIEKTSKDNRLKLEEITRDSTDGGLL